MVSKSSGTHSGADTAVDGGMTSANSSSRVTRLGALPSQAIVKLISDRVVVAQNGIEDAQVQPASLDLRLGADAWAMPGSVLPLPGENVRDLLAKYSRRQLDLSSPNILVRGEVYVVLLKEGVRLLEGLAAYCNSKSSIGRIDVQTRVLTDANPRYDRLAPGYHGELFLEIIPKSFDIKVRSGDSLNQMIFYYQRDILDGPEIRALHHQEPLLYDASGEVLKEDDPRLGWADEGGVLMTVDLHQPVVGWVAKKSLRPLDLSCLDSHDPRDYFDPITCPKEAALFLSREAFYILSTIERVVVPPSYAVEMVPYDTSAGEFRAHYAGFFDPGFGWGKDGSMGGTPAVLEVRPYEDELLVRHGQPVCKMAFERLTEMPDYVYGATGSHYAEQRGPRLSKYFAQSS